MKVYLPILSAFTLFCTNVTAQNSVIGMTCEYLTNPIGIDASNPRFNWRFEDNVFEKQVAYKVTVDKDSSALVSNKASVWNSGKVNSDKSLVVFSGNSLSPFTKYYWRVEAWDKQNKVYKSSISSFETGFLNSGNWKGAWISDGEDKDLKPAPYFRKVFDASKTIKSARAYIAAAGLYELYINGTRVGDYRLDPMFTRFDRRNLYVTYDVTQALQAGKNAVGVILGNGWYNFQSQAVWHFERAPWRNRPTFCMDLKITYTDGSEITISSDRDWKTSTGPIVYNSIYTGEHYDARLEQDGWNTINFDDSKWKNASYRKVPGQYISAEAMQPIRNVEKLQPVSIQKVSDSDYIFNIGRNIAGVTSLTIAGDAGTVVRVIHAERLDKNGKLDQSNIDYFLSGKTKAEDPFGTDIYTLNGKGTQTFMPHFDYKGFQYVEVKADRPISLTKESLTAYFMHSDVAPVGKIQSSNDIINKIYAATNASYLSNLFGYPTDCPQREKNGWTGDAHIAVETGLYNFDALTVYEKWLQDMRDEQQPNGTLPAIIPTDGWGYDWGNGPDWTSGIAIIPWNIYLFYGDDKILKDNYENIKRYVDRITTTAPEGLTSWGLGDWIPVKSKTPVEFTSSIYYYADAEIAAKIAKLFGRSADYEKYSQLKEKIKNAINNKYLNKEKIIYGEGFQTELAAPLYWGVVPENLRLQMAANLAKAVADNHFHLDVGLLGTKAILGALSNNGQAETAYRLASQKEYPSWGWWIVNGATTLYENWNIDQQRDLSLNHIMFGEIGAWLYKGLGGIQPDEQQPGFKNILLRPNFVEGLTEFSAEHTSPYGKIISSWKRTSGGIEWIVNIPGNSSATVLLPNTIVALTDNGKKVTSANSQRIEAGTHVFLLKEK